MILTDEQKNAVINIFRDIENQQIVTLGGLAGCGKTTVIRVIMQALKQKDRNFIACAFTGKATNVLRKKGMNANTIHSCIYRAYKDEEGNTIWNLISKDELEEFNVDGFIVDEASMVSKEIHEDLLSFDLPIIYVGDHGQLEPIGSKFNLMESPMYRLETVHRNAGEIAHFAEHLRKGNSPWDFPGKTKVQVVKERVVEERHLASVDQIICAFNKTRVQLNERVRKEKNIHYTFIAKGEKIICLRNNKKSGLFNGMQGVVTKIGKNDHFDFISDDIYFQNIKYDVDQFGKETAQFDWQQIPHPFDYAYAITCHKAQGDEWGNLIVYEQKCDKWDNVRWNYTAASRAKNGLIWIGVEEFRPYYL